MPISPLIGEPLVPTLSLTRMGRSSDSHSSGSESFRQTPRSSCSTPVSQLANVHYYKETTERLELVRSERHQVLMEDRPFASGGVCEAFRLWFLTADGEQGPLLVAKRYIFKEGTKGFREDHVNWYFASRLVRPFNELLARALPSSLAVTLLPVTRLLEIRGVWYSLEDFIEGPFCKYNNIFGDTERRAVPGEDATYIDLAAAFSHFSYCHSGNEFVVLDIQGVDSTYTDCALVSRAAGRFGYTDTGPTGLHAFLQRHTCSPICAALGLRPLRVGGGPAAGLPSPRLSLGAGAPALRLEGRSSSGARLRAKPLGAYNYNRARSPAADVATKVSARASFASYGQSGTSLPPASTLLLETSSLAYF